MSTATPARSAGSTIGSTIGPGLRPRRVRHEVRDALTVMAFSLAASAGVALVFRLLLPMGK